VQRSVGTLHHTDTPLPLCVIGAVTTSLIGRKQGFASVMTSRALQAGAEAGAATAALGMFEQGFYNRFGFATGSYDHMVSFDPQSLELAHIPYRAPVRLGPENAAEVQAAMAGRPLGHGAVVLHSVDIAQAEMTWPDNPFALGYRDDAGTLTHFLFGDLKDEHGPFRIQAMGYQNIEQLLELMRLLRELGDQIRSVKMIEPQLLQIQSLIEAPMRQVQRSQHTALESRNEAIAWWQLRILDLAPCVAAHTWLGEPVRFNLELFDPLEHFLDSGWRGISGTYVITVGAPSEVAEGSDPSRETVTCDVTAFTRLWFGICSATELRATERFAASDALCAKLDRAFPLPPTIPGWEF